MFENIVVLLNDIDASHAALECAIDLAVHFDASLTTLSILGDLPAYASFASVTAPATPKQVRDARRSMHQQLHNEAFVRAVERGLRPATHIVEARNVESVMAFLKEREAKLLVVSLHEHDYYSLRLWTLLFDGQSDCTCAVLGVA